MPLCPYGAFRKKGKKGALGTGQKKKGISYQKRAKKKALFLVLRTSMIVPDATMPTMPTMPPSF